MSLIPYYVLLNLGINGVIQARLSKSAPVFQKNTLPEVKCIFQSHSKNAIENVEAWEV